MWQWGRWPIEEADVNAIPLTLDTPQYTHTHYKHTAGHANRVQDAPNVL